MVYCSSKYLDYEYHKNNNIIHLYNSYISSQSILIILITIHINNANHNRY